jgi:hypothetical protein
MLMRAKALVVVLALVLALAVLAAWSKREQVLTGLVSQDYRTSQFAAQTGWITFRELWFTHSGR